LDFPGRVEKVKSQSSEKPKHKSKSPSVGGVKSMAGRFAPHHRDEAAVKIIPDLSLQSPDRR